MARSWNPVEQFSRRTDFDELKGRTQNHFIWQNHYPIDYPSARRMSRLEAPEFEHEIIEEA